MKQLVTQLVESVGDGNQTIHVVLTEALKNVEAEKKEKLITGIITSIQEKDE